MASQCLLNKAGLAVIAALCVSASALADETASFRQYRSEVLSSLEGEYARVVAAHPDDASIEALAERIGVLDEIAITLIRSFEATRVAAFDNALTAPKNPAASVQQPAAPAAGSYLQEHSALFSQKLPPPSLSEAELKVVREYYERFARAAGDYIAKRGSLVAAVDPASAASVLQLCMVIPFLHVADGNWSAKEVDVLPAWMRGSANLRLLEDFSFEALRPRTAYQFASAWRRQNALAEIEMTAYLREVSERLSIKREHQAAICCLRAAAKLAEDAKDSKTAVEIRLRLAEMAALLGHNQMAADEIKEVLAKYPDLAEHGKTVVLRLKYLYEAGQLEELAKEAPQHRADPRCRDALPQILYIAWVANRRQNDTKAAEEIQKAFLEGFSESPLAADMYFASAMTALAGGNYEEAKRMLEIIEHRYPQVTLASRAREIQDRLKNMSTPSTRPAGR